MPLDCIARKEKTEGGINLCCLLWQMGVYTEQRHRHFCEVITHFCEVITPLRWRRLSGIARSDMVAVSSRVSVSQRSMGVNSEAPGFGNTGG